MFIILPLSSSNTWLASRHIEANVRQARTTFVDIRVEVTDDEVVRVGGTGRPLVRPGRAAIRGVLYEAGVEPPIVLAGRTVVVPDRYVVDDERAMETKGLLSDPGEVTARLQGVTGGVPLNGKGVKLVWHQFGLEFGSRGELLLGNPAGATSHKPLRVAGQTTSTRRPARQPTDPHVEGIEAAIPVVVVLVGVGVADPATGAAADPVRMHGEGIHQDLPAVVPEVVVPWRWIGEVYDGQEVEPVVPVCAFTYVLPLAIRHRCVPGPAPTVRTLAPRVLGLAALGAVAVDSATVLE